MRGALVQTCAILLFSLAHAACGSGGSGEVVDVSCSTAGSSPPRCMDSGSSIDGASGGRRAPEGGSVVAAADGEPPMTNPVMGHPTGESDASESTDPGEGTDAGENTEAGAIEGESGADGGIAFACDDSTSTGYCVVYVDASSAQENDCEQQSAAARSTCPMKNLIGCCLVLGTEQCLYSPQFTSSIQSQCAANNGTWSTTP